MRQIWAAAFLTTFLLVGLANAAEQTQREEAANAKGKAEVLEQRASGEGNKTLPTAAEIITKPQAQSVDPVGEEPLDDAITCLARSIYMTQGRMNRTRTPKKSPARPSTGNSRIEAMELCISTIGK